MTLQLRFPARRGVGRGRGRGRGSKPKSPSSPTILTREHSMSFNKTIESGGVVLNLLKDYDADTVHRIVSSYVEVVVTGKVVVGDKYAANVAFGLKLSNSMPESISEVTSCPSKKVVSLPNKGQVKFRLEMPPKARCDLTDSDDELYLIAFADVDKAKDFESDIGTIEVKIVIEYVPKKGEEWC